MKSRSSPKLWACSSLSSSEKFLSNYDNMLEDWEKKNSESLVGTRCLQQAPSAEEEQIPSLLSPTTMERPGSKLVFPHITSRGSLIGKKVSCRTSIQSSITWRQKCRKQRMSTSLMILNSYQDRSCSNSLLALKQTSQSRPTPVHSSSSQDKQDYSAEKEQCKALFLSLAGAVGMRLICPPLQLPLLEMLLFFREQLSSKNRGGLWRFPVKLALATVRLFCGSFVHRGLTTLVCLAQMRVKNATICSNNCIPLANPVARKAAKADGFNVGDKANWDINGTPLWNAAVGGKFAEGGWNNKGVPVVEILIRERKSLEDDNQPESRQTAEYELEKAAVAVSVDELSLALTEVVETEGVKELEVSLPEKKRSVNEIEKEALDNGQGRHSEAEFDRDASEPEQDGDSQSQDTVKSLSELSAHNSLISRLNNDTEAEHNAKVDGDIELNCDQGKDGHIETEAKVMDVINSDSISAHNNCELPPGPTEPENVVAAVVSPSEEERNLVQRSPVADKICDNGNDISLPKMFAISCPKVDKSRTENYSAPKSYPEHPFADHPTCIDLRERRHTHGDQTYIPMQDLLPAPWGHLIYWHGRCKEGRPTLCVMFGKAVRELSGDELKHFITVTVSHLEHAEVNFFGGNVKQVNVVMDLEGLGFRRLPPMHILSSIGDVLNRDYAGRGAWITLVNAPMMLGLVMNAIQGVILRPRKGVVIDSSYKGFLEGNEKIKMMGSKYRPTLLKDFEASMLPVALGGDCRCSSDKPCKLGSEFLKLP